MPMLWLISQFPELDHLDPIERAAVLRRVPWWTYPQLAVGAILVGVVAGSATLLFAFFHGLGGWAAWAPGVVVTVIVVIYGYHSGVRGIRKSMRKELIKSFCGHRPPFCLLCGYDLRGSTSDTCTECGRSTLGVPGIAELCGRFVGRRRRRRSGH